MCFTNKTSATIIPIITKQFAANSIIYTEEFSSYRCLLEHGFLHDTVGHKYEFVNSVTGVNTQAVECFNNELKKEMKSRKRVMTNKREDFLKNFFTTLTIGRISLKMCSI
jgi:transposase-like protein